MSSTPGFPPVVIRASAGTGKTYQLSNRFLALLASGVEPDQILASTFTRKAAGEIFDRILLRLAQAATDTQARRDLADKIGQPRLSAADCQQLLVSTVRNMHRLRIGTLDSYFAKVAGTFALELGLPQGWSICDEHVDARLRDEAIEAVLDREQTQDILTLMHLLSKGEVKRGVSQMVLQTVNSLFNLYREAAADAWDQVPQPTPLSSEKLAETVEALRAFACPQNKNVAKGWAGDLENLAAQDWATFVSKGIASKVLAQEDTYSRWPIDVNLRTLYEQLIGHARAVLLRQLAQQTLATHKLLEKFSGEYRALQHGRRALRFDDITHRLATVGDVASPERMAFRLDVGIAHLLLDEFQDTSLAQWQVLRPLAQIVAGGKPRRTAGPTSFFCVGDVKQAIYGWRGGVAEIFDGLNGELPGLTSEPLNCSYRSSPCVVDAVNRIFSNLTRHPNLERHAGFVAQWQAAFPQHSTALGDLAGYVELRTASAADEDETAAAALHEYVAEQVAELVQRAPGRSIGILVRKNDSITRLIHLLRQRNVAASEEGGNPLTDSAAVEVLLSLLTLADHPGDTAARFHVANSPLAEIAELQLHSDAAAAVRLSRKLRQRLLDDGYGPTVFHFAKRLAGVCSQRDQNRLQQLVELAYQYQPQSTLRCDDFISLATKQRVADPSSAHVRVMTIHQSKGLEFDIVVLPELEVRLSGQAEDFVVGRPSPTQPVDLVCRHTNEHVRQLLPAKFQKLFDEAARQDIHESLCLLYVATTRAVHALHLIVAPARPNEKNPPKTWSGLLRAALAPGEPATPEKLLWSSGNPNWPAAQPAPTAVAAAEAFPASLPRIAFAPPLAQSCRNLERTSPSSLEGGSTILAAGLLAVQDRTRINRGTLFHAWLEQIEWLDDGLPATVALQRAAAELASEIGVPDNLDQQIAEFLAAIAQPAIAALLKRSAYASSQLEVLRERTFVAPDNGTLLRGAIDRLVLIRRGKQLVAAEIVDFKTDALPANDPAPLAKKIEFYRPQLAAYRRAVSHLWRLDPSLVSARLVFLDTGAIAEL